MVAPCRGWRATGHTQDWKEGAAGCYHCAAHPRSVPQRSGRGRRGLLPPRSSSMAWQNARLRESVVGCYHGARAEGCYHCAAQAVLTHANGLVEGVVGCYHGAKLSQPLACGYCTTQAKIHSNASSERGPVRRPESGTAGASVTRTFLRNPTQPRCR